MPVRRRVVIQEEQMQGELPEWAREGALLQEQLATSGRWSELSEWLHIYRHTGYAAIDVAGFLLHYFASGQRESLKAFGVRVMPLRSQLAALGQRREFPTPSSVSRALGAVTKDDVCSIGPRVLLETSDAGPLLRHPAAAVRDTFGEPWHVFDVDATVKAFRERALPKGPDLPKPRRRVGPDLARRGYAGRKRGELRCSRGTLQHAGTGLWIAIVLSPERSDGAASLPTLLDGLELTCRIGGISIERAILRADGAGGNVPWLTVCQQRGVRYLTRWGHYALLNQADVQQRVERGAWYRVPSSGSGPQREAMELGDFELHAGPKTRDANGEGFEPVRSRIVLSRFRVIEETSSVGHFVDGWQYELFATNLDAGAWPAPELVAQYFGRAAQENRFAQEDRELGLDHVFSYNLPGQELACLFGLMVGNLHLTRGFAQHTPPTEMPAPVPRVAVETMRVADAAPLATASGEAVSVEPDTVEMPTDASPETIAPSANPPAAALADMTLPATAASPAATTAAVAALTVDEVRDLFDGLDWGSLLKRLGSAWQRAPSGDALICSEGAILHASKVIPSRHAGGLPSLRMLGSAPVCGQCPQRLPCAQTESPHFAKKVSVPLTAEQGERIDVVLSAKTNRQRRAPHPDAPRPLSPTKPTSPRHQLPTVLPRLGSPTPGPYAPSEYRLLPAEFRHAFRRACQEVRITVAVPPIPAPPGQRPLGIADTDAERQRRRRTWSARLRDNELPAAVDIALLVTGPIHALAALGLAAREPAKSRPDHGKI